MRLNRNEPLNATTQEFEKYVVGRLRPVVVGSALCGHGRLSRFVLVVKARAVRSAQSDLIACDGRLLRRSSLSTESLFSSSSFSC